MGHDTALDLLDSLKRDSTHMSAIWELAGIHEGLLETRTSAVIDYFGPPTEGASAGDP